MSKIVLLGDTHFGIKQGDKFLAEYQYKFFDEVLFPYLEKHNITDVIQFGDWFDTRRAIRHDTMHLVRSKIIPRIEAGGQNWKVLVGNHDMGVRENIHPNACTELLSRYDCFDVIDKPTTVKYDDFEIDLIPWICRENRKEVKDFIKDSKSAYCGGHFELSGFYFYKGIKSDGVQKKFLSDYHQVWSGHFHTISSNGNIQYLGTPYQLTFGDADTDYNLPDSSKTKSFLKFCWKCKEKTIDCINAQKDKVEIFGHICPDCGFSIREDPRLLKSIGKRLGLTPDQKRFRYLQEMVDDLKKG